MDKQESNASEQVSDIISFEISSFDSWSKGVPVDTFSNFIDAIVAMNKSKLSPLGLIAEVSDGKTHLYKTLSYVRFVEEKNDVANITYTDVVSINKLRLNAEKDHNSLLIIKRIKNNEQITTCISVRRLVTSELYSSDFTEFLKNNEERLYFSDLPGTNLKFINIVG